VGRECKQPYLTFPGIPALGDQSPVHTLLLDLSANGFSRDSLFSTVNWGESGLAGRVGTKFRPSKQRLTCMSRLFDFRKHSGEASKTPSAPPKTSPCSRFSVFKVLNFVPTRPASPDSPHFTVLSRILFCKIDLRVVRYSIYPQLYVYSLHIFLIGNDFK